MTDTDRSGVADGDGYRALGRLRVHPRRRERIVGAFVARLFLGPRRPQCTHPIPHGRKAFLEGHVGASVGQLLGVPPDPYTQDHPPFGKSVECGDGLGQIQHLVFERQRDPGGQLDRGRGLGRHGQRHEWIHHVPVAARQLVAARIVGLKIHRYVAVFGHPERIEAPIFELFGHGAGAATAQVIEAEVSELHPAISVARIGVEQTGVRARDSIHEARTVNRLLGIQTPDTHRTHQTGGTPGI